MSFFPFSFALYLSLMSPCNLSSILVTARVGTSAAFACFSMAANVTKCRHFLFLGGLVGSSISFLLSVHFASSIFGGSTAIFNLEVPYHYRLHIFTLNY